MDQLAEIAAIASIKTEIINPVIKLLIVVGVIYFLYGVVHFMQNRDDKDGKNHMIWGLVGLAVMVSAFGLVNFLYSLVASLK